MVEKDKGLELACRFSSITNRLRYCGPKDAYLDFYNLLQGKDYDREKIRKHFSKYEGLYVYLKYIADKLGKDFLDYEILEAYWLGNDLLEKFSRDDQKNIILGLVKRGLPQKHADRLIERLPDGLNLMHSFNVLFVGVGMTTGSVPTNIQTMNKCIVSVGKVLKITDRQLILNVSPLKIEARKMAFSKPEIQYSDYVKEFLPGLKVGSEVALHWDFACKILAGEDSYNLIKYTQKNINSLNEINFFA